MEAERSSNDVVSIRTSTGADAKAIEWVAERDSRRAPDAPALVAEVNGRIVAARSLRSGEVTADPFSHTAHLVEMLDLEASRLTRRERLPRLRARASSAPGYARA